jgi:hypothetical protein
MSVTHDEIWHRFYFAAITGVVARQGLPNPEDVAAMVQRCAAFADEAQKEVQRGSPEPEGPRPSSRRDEYR